MKALRIPKAMEMAVSMDTASSVVSMIELERKESGRLKKQKARLSVGNICARDLTHPHWEFQLRKAFTHCGIIFQ